MAEGKSIESLVAARDLLKTGLDKSRALGLELDETSLRLETVGQRLLSLESAFRPISRKKCTFLAIGDHIECAIRPADAVLKVFESVRELENSLLASPCSNLPCYLSTVRKLEQALRFLSDNCLLAIQWLQGVIELLEDNGMTNERYVSNLKSSLSILQDLQFCEMKSRHDGGALSIAFDKLVCEFKQLLTENSVPSAFDSLTECSGTKDACVPSSPFPASATQKLQAILERLNMSNQLESCIHAYVDVRTLNARASLQALHLEYLESPTSQSDDEQIVGSDMERWSKHLQYAVKHVFEHEYRLCMQVFEKLGQEIWTRCFAMIASHAGLAAFLQFGNKFTESKKSPDKLLNLLKVFAVLDDLRSDFTQLFGTKACTEIQTLTRALIRNVVHGAWEIFWELSYQVELQRQSPPPSDGSVPLLVSFVTEYCNQLLGDMYRPTMIQVLVIHKSWKHEKYQEGLFTNQIYNVVKEIGLNLDAWSKAYHDRTLSFLFMMNNHHHFCNLKGTKLGDMMGESWLRAHEQYKDSFSTLYLKESWGKLLAPITQAATNLTAEEELIDRDLLKKRLKAFNEAFDDMYKKQYNWIISDEDLREKMSQRVVQAIVPIYGSYIKKYRTSFTPDDSANRYIKHSVQSLENMLGSLFQPKHRKLGNSQSVATNFPIDNIKNAMTSQLYLTLTAA
ncbi:exocyst complex component EXO70A1 isoform X1 [Syzygium oleosum]|uniref:exocyst complex component EXO70A1 isoform X1 n=1 Tax=Syzygium oleosum TaxID=219896 RepID=UPI0011D1FED4|nr:exocyst complex component EXO70A1 isoform X1 [Syzygium oleosum]